jgi:hypothetical protein
LFEYTLGIGETEPNPVFYFVSACRLCRFTADADFKKRELSRIPPAELSLIVLKTSGTYRATANSHKDCPAAISKMVPSTCIC